MKVLVIDDAPDELGAAVDALKAKGLDPIPINPSKKGEWCGWVRAMENADAVLTDLFWKQQGEPDYPKEPKPFGLLVVIHALHLQKPVVICSQSKEMGMGNHGPDHGWICDHYLKVVLSGHEHGYFADPQAPSCFGWAAPGSECHFLNTKDWDGAVNLLLGRIKAKNG